jgi:PAS domain S-box-containing protein
MPRDFESTINKSSGNNVERLSAQSDPGPCPVAVLHADPRDWLYSTLQSWPVSHQSSETLLGRREGEDVDYLNDLRWYQDAAMKLRFSITDKTLLSARIVAGAKLDTPMFGRDCRNVPVVGIGQAVPGTDWYLVAKLDQSEMVAHTIRGMTPNALAGLSTLFIAGGSLILLRQRRQLLHADAMREVVTEKVRALNLLGTIADSSEDAIFAKDFHGRYPLFNHAACRFVGKSVEEVLGRDDRHIVPAEQAEALIAIGRPVITLGRIETNEETLDTALGRRVFSATKGPLQGDDGQVIGLFGISCDITEHKCAEAQLRLRAESFHRSDLALAAIADCESATLIAVNPAFAATRGYGCEELVGKPILTVFPHDLAEKVSHQIAELDLTGHGVFESEHVHRDGRRFPVLLVTLLKSGDGQNTRRAIYALDISKHKQAAEALARQTVELRTRNEELERLNCAMVGRELDIIELKRQVNELSRELGQEQPFAHDLSNVCPPTSGPAGDAA